MIRYFFLSLNVLNSLLGLAVAAVGYFVVVPLWNPVARVSLPAMQGAATPSWEQTMPPQRALVTDYAVISDKNLFHPERKIPILPEKQLETAVPKPDVTLFGTLIADDATSYAFVEDKKAPYSTEGRGKRQLVLKKGDNLSGYILSEIGATRIVLVKGEEKLVVMLDEKAKKRAGESPAAPSTARPVAAGGITPPAPSAPPPVSSPASRMALPASRPPSQSIVPPSPQAVPSPGQAATVPGSDASSGSGLPARSVRRQELKTNAERQRSPQGSPGN